MSPLSSLTIGMSSHFLMFFVVAGIRFILVYHPFKKVLVFENTQPNPP